MRELRLRGFAPQSTAAMLPCVHPPVYRINGKVFGRIEEGESERECAMDIPCQTMRQKQYLHLYAGVSMLFGTGSKVP